ncbi:MAG: type IV secretion system DNA-binding domain-containing protein [Bradyrhizobiaceae bacterium]|nr:type IV secretion system DNA-binding domain-containing protein [Bradyrhizobiaceae bacterium]
METHPPVIARRVAGTGIALSREERARHVYIVGKSGSGKSTVLFNLAMHDISAGEGVCVIDPHGDLAEAVIDALPPSRTNDLCYLNVADVDFPVGFNPLARVPPKRHALAASGIVAAFKHLWSDSWGPRLEHFLYNGVAALLCAPRPTLIDLPRLYTDKAFRAALVPRIADPVVTRFWTQEFPGYDQRFQAEAAAPILNKAGQFAASPALRNILGQHAPKFDLGRAMNERRILIANLARGQVGEQAANLIGSLLLSHLQLVAMRRSELPAHARIPWFTHIDEFQSFSTDTLAYLLSESRKFAAYFSLANQIVASLAPAVRTAVLGNAGTLMVFRVSASDAEVLAPEFHPYPAHELIDQKPFRAMLRRLDGEVCSAHMEPPLFGSRRRLQKVVAQSRRNFSRPRAVIERSLFR